MAYRFKHGDRPLDDYTIQRAVGSGGFGEVYYAMSDGGREVALKYLRQNPEAELRGVSHCINLKSPHLVSIFDVKKSVEGDYFIIMEYCSGPSLRDLLIAEPKGFAPEKATFFVRELAKGLAYLHDRGIVHRDLKPGNVFYDDSYVKIGDYGLSKFISVSRHSVQTSSVGTVHYMAPEIGSGNYSRSVDIYALGVMLYEMLLGRVPFEGSTMAEILMKHLTAQPEVDALPQPFGTVIRKALEKDPTDRYASVDEMIDDLLAVEDVKKSLAGFSPQSLQGAVRYDEADHRRSPMPSPNPVPAALRRPARNRAIPETFGEIGAHPLPPKVARRMDRLSHKIDKRMAKLRGGKPPVQTAGQAAPDGNPQPGAAGAGGRETSRRRHIIPAILMTLALAIGTGVACANAFGVDELGGATGMLIVLFPLGVGISRRLGQRLGGRDAPQWLHWMIRLFVCAPALILGVAPMLSLGPATQGSAWAVVIALIVQAVFFSWEDDYNVGAEGRLGFGNAFGAAIMALFVGGIALQALSVSGSSVRNTIMISAIAAAGGTLVFHINAWWLATPSIARGGRRRHRKLNRDADGDEDDAENVRGTAVVVAMGIGRGGEPPFALPVDYTAEDAAAFARTTGTAVAHQSNRRWWMTRAFWSVAAFVFMGVSLVCFLMPIVGYSPEDDHTTTAAIIGCIAAFTLMIFALRKISLQKRVGFWRETLRPFLQTLFLFGIGATITGIAREHGHFSDGMKCVPAEGFILLIVGLVLSSLLLIIVTAFRGGRRRRPPAPFVQPGSSYAADSPNVTSPDEPAGADPSRADG